MRHEVDRWWRSAIDALGEEPPHPDATHAACLAFVDRVLAHAEVTGALERVTYRTDGPVPLLDAAGEEHVLVPGNPIVLVDPGGRAYRLVAEGAS